MLIGVISDTHGQVELARQAVRMFESLEVDLVLHCGDIGSVAVIALFSAWPTHFVFGNVDDHYGMGAAIRAAGQTCHDWFGTLELEGRRIAFLHSDDATLFRETLQSGRWDLVCYGHTHVAENTRLGRTVVVNPGALVRTDHPAVAVVRLPALEVVPINL